MSLLLQFLFLSLSFTYDLFQFGALDVKVGTAVGDNLVGFQQFIATCFQRGLCLAYALLVQFVVQAQVLDLLGEVLVLAVVAHVLHLVLKALYVHLVLLDDALALGDFLLGRCYVLVDLLYAGFQTSDFVLQVLNLQGKFAAESLDLVNLGHEGLQLVEVLQLVLDHQFCRVFYFCHLN